MAVSPILTGTPKSLAYSNLAYLALAYRSRNPLIAVVHWRSGERPEVTQSDHCLMQSGWPDSDWQQFRLTTLLVASLRARLWVRHFLWPDMQY